MPSVCVMWHAVSAPLFPLLLVVLVARVDVEQFVSLVLEEADRAVGVLHQGLGVLAAAEPPGAALARERRGPVVHGKRAVVEPAENVNVQGSS